LWGVGAHCQSRSVRCGMVCVVMWDSAFFTPLRRLCVVYLGPELFAPVSALLPWVPTRLRGIRRCWFPLSLVVAVVVVVVVVIVLVTVVFGPGLFAPVSPPLP
jgi:hypothetical protein